MKQFGYTPFGTTARMFQSNNPDLIAQAENMAGEYGRDLRKEQHEMGLQRQEQARRQYDSETQRQKMGLLGGLLGAPRRIG